MTAITKHEGQPEDTRPNGACKVTLIKISEEILSLWEARVRKEVHTAGDLLRPVLRDTLPRFLLLLANALDGDPSEGLCDESSALIQGHACERAQDTCYGPTQIVQELEVLREIVLHTLKKSLVLSLKDYEIINTVFDQAIQKALIEFFMSHAFLREQFMATLSHDLRNPIACAKMSAEMIERMALKMPENGYKDKLLSTSRRIVKTMQRADRMIQDLLDASVLRIGSKIPIKLGECELLSLVSEAVQNVDSNQCTRINIQGPQAKGYWDCEGLRRCIENLINNAIKYGQEGTPITILISRSQDRVQLSIHNYGRPIPQEDQKIIFDSFRRSKNIQKDGQKGWGIGLALARAVTESLGGTIKVESAEGIGTTFRIDIPEDARGQLENNKGA